MESEIPMSKPPKPKVKSVKAWSIFEDRPSGDVLYPRAFTTRREAKQILDIGIRKYFRGIVRVLITPLPRRKDPSKPRRKAKKK